MSDDVKIIIVDDHNMVRQSVSLALETQKNFKVIGQAENGKILLELVKKQRPDVVILDLEMPVMNGWEALDHLRINYPSIKVVIMSQYYQGLYVQDLIDRGAKGFLAKNSDFKTLISAIYEVIDLGYFFCDLIPRKVIKKLIVNKTINPIFRKYNLNTSEIDTLLFICEDKTTKEIATALDISERTIERHKTSLFAKTGARTPAGLVLFAIKYNMITMEG